MPLLDVTEVLDCAEFYDTFELRRVASFVDGRGENHESDGENTTIQGVVVPASKSVLQRLPDLQNLSGTIEIYTKFILNNARGSAGADRIYYRGALYVVLDVADFSSFGTGFVHAICTLTDYTPESVPE